MMMKKLKVLDWTLIVILLLSPVILSETFSPSITSWSKEELLPLSDNCFCKLEGHIDDCSCKVNTVDDFNNKKIYPRIKSLVAKDFFRYFQYQPNKKCRFWDSSSGKCSSSYCQVKQCSTTDLPPGFIGEASGHVDEDPPEDVVTEDPRSCDSNNNNNDDYQDKVDDTISESVSKDIRSWRQHDEQETSFCEMDEGCQDCVHVDLTLNPERFTGYSGEASRRIWRSIYEENCFSPPGVTTKPSFSAAFGQETMNSLCLEKRAFYRVVSGLHSSITIHLTANYPTKKMPSTPFLSSDEVWGPNVEMFQERFDPGLTNGQGPYWLKNLYFVYLMELRALAKAAPYLAHQTFFTGRESEDKDTLIAVRELLNLISSFPDHFDETSMFTGGRQAEVDHISYQDIKSLINFVVGIENRVQRAFQECHSRH